MAQVKGYMVRTGNAEELFAIAADGRVYYRVVNIAEKPNNTFGVNGFIRISGTTAEEIEAAAEFIGNYNINI